MGAAPLLIAFASSVAAPAVLAVLSLGLGVAQAHAAEPALTVYGGCRDGQPNGSYELKDRRGALRVLGAFHAGKRTGTFIFWNASGGRLAAIPYDEDVRNGTIALWHVGGTPPREIGRKLEAPVHAGRAHGIRRSWHRDGRPHTEAEYADDRLVRVAAWDASGHPLPESEATRIETDDVKRTDRELAALERLVADHRPVCAPAGQNAGSRASTAQQT